MGVAEMQRRDENTTREREEMQKIDKTV